MEGKRVEWSGGKGSIVRYSDAQCSVVKGVMVYCDMVWFSLVCCLVLCYIMSCDNIKEYRIVRYVTVQYTKKEGKDRLISHIPTVIYELCHI